MTYSIYPNPLSAEQRYTLGEIIEKGIVIKLNNQSFLMVEVSPMMNDFLKAMKINSKSELLLASPLELLNIIQADKIGCHIITVTKDIIKKLQLINYDLEDYSLDTVKIFYKDAVDAGFKIS